MNLSSLRFENPWWLLLLPLALLLLLLRGRRGAAGSVLFSSSTRFLRDLGTHPRRRAGGLGDWLMAAAFACGVFALARPQLMQSHEMVKASGVEIAMAIDVSQSMAIEDFFIGKRQVNRLAAAKKVTREFVQGRPSDRIGIVAFAGRPYVPSPLTLDHEWVLQSIDRLELGVVESGTAIGSALAAAATRLEEREVESRVIVLLTDGSNNSGDLAPLDAAALAKTLGVRIYTIAVGTPGVHRIPMTDQFGRKVRAQMSQEFDEETLQKIAELGDGAFFHARDTQALKAIFDKIDDLEKTEMEKTTVVETEELFHLPTGAAFALAALSLLLSQTLLARSP